MWKDIKNYEGLYKVNEDGEVLGVKRNKLISPHLVGKRKEYLQVNLCKDGKIKAHYLHRLVAEAFIPNPDNLPEVNHRDENKLNNTASNLEWCSSSYNSSYGTRTDRIKAKTAYKVCQYSMNGELIAIYDSTRDAANATGADNSTISKVCRGEKNSHHGYKWAY